MQKLGSKSCRKEAKNFKMIPNMQFMQKVAKQNEANKENLNEKFALQNEAKIMQNGLHFASISRKRSEKSLSGKGTPYIYPLWRRIKKVLIKKWRGHPLEDTSLSTPLEDTLSAPK
jgi:hypothetical protein